MMPTTFGSDAYFCATASAGAAPCSTGVSPWTSWTFSTYFWGRVATAYFAQLNCSVPRKPAAPVIGVTIASFIGLLQLMLWAAEATFWPPLAAAATMLAATTATAIAIAFFILNSSLLGGSASRGRDESHRSPSPCQ